MEAYRLFSETICTELEQTTPGPGASPPPPGAFRTRTGFTPGKPSGKQRDKDTSGKARGNQGDMDTVSGKKKANEKNQPNVDRTGSEVVEPRPRAAEKRRPAAAVGERADVEQKNGDENGSGGPNTFMTALKRSDGFVHPGGLEKKEEMGEKLKRAESAETGLETEDRTIADGGGGDCQQGEEGGGNDRDALYDAQGITAGSNNNNSSLVRQGGKRKIDIILSAASREFVSPGVDVDTVAARKGRGRRGRGQRPSMDWIDTQRSTLRSAR